MRVRLLLIFFSTSCFAQTGSIPDSTLHGDWLIEVTSNDIGAVTTLMHFESGKDSFQGWTRKGAYRDILGSRKSTLARVFTNYAKKGALVQITDGIWKQRGDTLAFAGIFRSAMGTYSLRGRLYNGQLTAELRNGKRELRGTLTGRRAADVSYPLHDYPIIVSEALQVAKTNIYNPKELKTKEWRSFEKDMNTRAARFQDDMELVFAFYYYASKLPFSHFALTRLAETEEHVQPTPTRFLSVTEKTSKTAVLKITSFGGTAAEVDSAFTVIFAKGYTNLIVDLRDNPGGSVEAGMAFAKHVVDTTLIGGYFVTQNWFNQHDALPTQTQLASFPFFSESNFDLIIEGIHRENGLVLKVVPEEKTFTGRLFIVTNENTASTCEPIVAGLKGRKNVTLVGETSAGSMLNGEPFQLSAGFSVFVPTADYYTMQGFRIDQQGVEPDIPVTDEDPVEYILGQLIK